MKKSRFTDSQILGILRQAEAGTPAPELCWEHNISSATLLEEGACRLNGDDHPLIQEKGIFYCGS